MEDMLRNLRTAIFNVMETMYFLLPDEDGAEAGIENSLATFIGITGSPGYRISLTCDRDLVAAMAVDLLGIDVDELEDDMVYKCLSETANVVAGKFLLSFSDDESRNVTLPSADGSGVFPGGAVSDRSELSLSFNGLGMNAVLEVIDHGE